MKIKILKVLCLLSWVLSAQSPNVELPTDSTVVKGVLPNGLSYYLKSTQATKNVASFYIIQNVGSILENESQRGLAHFLEHMAFNGTKNFKGKGILNTLEKKGLVFGKDINAYTSFDETVYNINNLSTDEEGMNLGLMILHDWSNELLLTEEEIDAERGVIKEEWRTRQSGGMRILQQQLPVMFNHTLYAERMPIGLMSVVENFDYSALRSFYHDWYRTDLQAIAIVGDFELKEVEEKIKKIFGSIPKVVQPKPRIEISIPENKELDYVLAMDKEVASSSVTMGIRHPKKKKPTTTKTFKKSLFQGMAIHLLSNRLKELSVKPEAAFLSARVHFGSQSRTSNALTLQIRPKPDNQQIAFEQVITELNRAIRFGFTETEVERAKKTYVKSYQNQLKRKDKWSHAYWVEQIKSNFLEGTTLTDMGQEFALVQEIFKQLAAADLQQELKKMYTPYNRYVMVTGVEGKNNLTKTQVLTTLAKVETNSDLKPYKEKLAGSTLLGDLKIDSGTITTIKENEGLEATTFVLSNGLKVHYKFVNKNKNEVQLKAMSNGGMSLVSNQDLPSANLLGSVVQFSGLGAYNATDLPKILTGKSARADVKIGRFSESISGASVTEDVETMLQLMYLRFMAPRFDKQGFEVVMQNVENYLTRKSQRVNDQMKDSLVTVLYGKSHPRKRILDSTFVKEISFNYIQRLYHERFANPEDFEFFIVGDVQTDVLKPLLEKYVASLPTEQQKYEKWKPITTRWKSDLINKKIGFEMEDPKTSVHIAYKLETPFSLQKMWTAQALKDVLQLRFTESLREEKGGTYGASVGINLTKKPKGQLTMSVRFDCDPDKANELIEIVYKELKAIAKGEIKSEDLIKTKTNYLKEREDAKNYNRYQMQRLLNYYREGYDMDLPENFEKLVTDIHEKDLKKMMKKMLKNGHSYQIVFHPKAKK
ncbi:M16 family metallopeptidase [Ochrovirga pacifica]|uniref:M16 family metallopeptidase n=1 Tax=Ochrovirga pacifica TaxID=1042376 RepID=UPI0002559FCF|nr:M16 family metallopeptidase [Ochrovirga pacifica]